jgi:hypothetical protein
LQATAGLGVPSELVAGWSLLYFVWASQAQFACRTAQGPRVIAQRSGETFVDEFFCVASRSLQRAGDKLCVGIAGEFVLDAIV